MSQVPASLTVDPDRVDADFAYLLGAFCEVLQELGAGDIAAAMPWGGMTSDSAAVDQRRLTQALSIAFRLATLAEENALAQHRRRRQDEEDLDAISGHWGRILADLQRAGHEALAIAEGLTGIEVEPVLTAHHELHAASAHLTTITSGLPTADGCDEMTGSPSEPIANEVSIPAREAPEMLTDSPCEHATSSQHTTLRFSSRWEMTGSPFVPIAIEGQPPPTSTVEMETVSQPADSQ